MDNYNGFVFHSDTTDNIVDELLTDPYNTVRNEHMYYVFMNILYLFFVATFLMGACKGNIQINKTSNEVKISNVKK